MPAANSFGGLLLRNLTINLYNFQGFPGNMASGKRNKRAGDNCGPVSPGILNFCWISISKGTFSDNLWFKMFPEGFARLFNDLWNGIYWRFGYWTPAIHAYQSNLLIPLFFRITVIAEGNKRSARFFKRLCNVKVYEMLIFLMFYGHFKRIFIEGLANETVISPYNCQLCLFPVSRDYGKNKRQESNEWLFMKFFVFNAIFSGKLWVKSGTVRLFEQFFTSIRDNLNWSSLKIQSINVRQFTLWNMVFDGITVREGRKKTNRV